MQTANHERTRGFTLVELLVVMVILSLLAALAATAVFSAIGKAKATRIQIEMSQMGQHFELMKQEYGKYPPSSKADAGDYLQEISQYVSSVQADLDAEVAEFDPDDPEGALAFWLKGFSRSPTNPITGDGTRDFAFEFDDDQWVSVDKKRYLPPLETASYPYRYTSSGGASYTISSAGVDDTWGTDDDLTFPK